MRNLYTEPSKRRASTGAERAGKPMALGLGFLLLVCIVGASYSTLAAQKGGSQSSGIVKFSNLGIDNGRHGGDSTGRYHGMASLGNLDDSNGRHGGDSTGRYHGMASLGNLDDSNGRHGGDSTGRYHGIASLGDVDYSNGRHGGDSTGRYHGIASLGNVDNSNGRHGGDSTGRYHGMASFGNVDDSNGRHGGDSTGRYHGIASLGNVDYSNGRHGGDSTGRYSTPNENNLENTRIVGSNNLTVVAFPNPTSGILQVRIQGTEGRADAAYLISITDAFGKQLLASGLASSLGTGGTRIDLSGYAPGIYMVTIESGNERAIARVLKQ